MSEPKETLPISDADLWEVSKYHAQEYMDSLVPGKLNKSDHEWLERRIRDAIRHAFDCVPKNASPAPVAPAPTRDELDKVRDLLRKASDNNMDLTRYDWTQEEQDGLLLESVRVIEQALDILDQTKAR